MKTSEILNRAAEIMMERGHGKGQYIGDTGRVCVLGATCLASGLTKKQCPQMGNQAPGYTYISKAVGRVAWFWNDSPETTEAMALGALHEAAILAKEQGD